MSFEDDSELDYEERMLQKIILMNMMGRKHARKLHHIHASGRIGDESRNTETYRYTTTD